MKPTMNDYLNPHTPVMPILVIHDALDALPLAEALLEGGMRAIEITLRTKDALLALTTIRKHLPSLCVGAGTVTSPSILAMAIDAGAQFIVTPGCTDLLLNAAAKHSHLPILPGVSTLSEVMRGMEYGWSQFKFFPAHASGGVAWLQAVAGPLPQCGFCPTGGIGAHNYRDYLAQSNVFCVGGSWIAPTGLIQEKNWYAIKQLAMESGGQ